MPLRDHFHPPLSDEISWDALHGQWPAVIVIELNKLLPPQFRASPHIHLGAGFEIDVAAKTRAGRFDTPSPSRETGGTAVWAPPEPTFAVATELPEQDEYEIQIFETELRRLVAAVEIVSPANKDRPENRTAFAAKCISLLAQGVSVSIVDVVTSRRSNLYTELLNMMGQYDPSLAPTPPPLYAAACRWGQRGPAGRLETWTTALALDQQLPTLPLWLTPDLSVPLDLKSSYEATCEVLRIT